jgi:hypothetical protein
MLKLKFLSSISLPASSLMMLLVMYTGNALAAGNAESFSWQFQTSADKANQSITLDMIQKRQSGYYAAPIYNTNIARQFNCNVTANSTGTQGTSSTVANSPSTSGAISNAAGSTSASDTSGTGSSTSTSTQSNSGTVGAGINGSTSTSLQGSATQALNSNQTNSGAQTASIGTSSACMFGAIN